MLAIPLHTPSLTPQSLSPSLSHTPFLSLPTYPTFPSHPWGVLCATAETTDGAQHHPESERDGDGETQRERERIEGGCIHYLHHLVLEY